MVDGLEATEDYDGTITVHVLRDKVEREKIRCNSYEEAVATVKTEQDGETTLKIEDRDGDIVFSSVNSYIEDWEKAWKNEKRSLSVNVENHECPYDHLSCVADDLCGQCKMDKARNQHET